MKKPIIIVLVIAIIAAGGGFFAYNSWYNGTEHQTDLANDSFARQEYDEALATYTMLAEREPENMEFAQMVSDSLVKLEKHQEAITSLEALLAKDNTNVINWTTLIAEKELVGIEPLALGTLYTNAYEATKDASFDEWILAHQPEMPVVGMESGDYTNVDYVSIEGKGYELSVVVDGEAKKRFVGNSKLYLEHGNNVITITNSNEYGFEKVAVYDYNIDNVVKFKSALFEEKFKALTGMENIMYKDLKNFDTIALVGDHMYVSGRAGTFGERISYIDYQAKGYGNYENGTVYNNYGEIATSEDLALFSGLEYLTFGFQPEGFSEGLRLIDSSKLRSFSVINQGDFTQELFEEVVVPATKLGYISLEKTPVTNINDLRNHKEIYSVSIGSFYNVSYEELAGNENIKFYVYFWN